MEEQATLGGGCFWCLEAAYEQIEGVVRIVSGYAGGTEANPTYEAVCSGATGHAEVVQLTYDTGKVAFRDLLDIFFTIHDPTTPNRQGADVGTQYRSIILYEDEEQRRVAEEAIEQVDASGVWEGQVVTELEPLREFYAAEAHHQQYYRRHPQQPYCRAVIAPKLAELRRSHFERLRRSEDGSGERGVRTYRGEPGNPLEPGGIAD
jgi:peptide-methionine (S)-S-oxide reductase